MTKEECIERASKFSSRTKFSLGDRPAYEFARNNGIMDELFEDKRLVCKYNSDEERKEAHKQSNREYRKTHKKQIAKKTKKWRDKNHDKWIEYQRKYYSEHVEDKREYQKQWRKDNNSAEKQKEYRKTKKGRAICLSNAYKHYDRDTFYADTTISNDWIISNLFSGQSCVYCGDSNWRHLGADRIDNNKPHSEENVVCSCGICNVERQILLMSVSDFKTYRINNPLPKWKDSDFE